MKQRKAGGLVHRVRCYECGKIYDFDQDDFCPRCGAFTQPPKSTVIDADGSVIRVDGLNERGHAGSFVHEELHEENRERRRAGLSKGVRRSFSADWQSIGQKVRPVQRKSAKTRTPDISWGAIVVGAIILLDLLGSLFGF